MTYFNRKLMKRDIPASATVEGALVIPVILYAVAAVMFLLQLISIRMHVNDALYNALRKFNTYSYTSQMLTGEIYKSTFFAIFVDEIGSDYAKKHYIAGGVVCFKRLIHHDMSKSLKTYKATKQKGDPHEQTENNRPV